MSVYTFCPNEGNESSAYTGEWVIRKFLITDVRLSYQNILRTQNIYASIFNTVTLTVNKSTKR